MSLGLDGQPFFRPSYRNRVRGRLFNTEALLFRGIGGGKMRRQERNGAQRHFLNNKRACYLGILAKGRDGTFSAALQAADSLDTSLKRQRRTDLRWRFRLVSRLSALRKRWPLA
jgi:hypothetical protein